MKLRVAIVAGVLTLLAGPAAEADVVRLKDGRTLRGDIERQDDGTLVVHHRLGAARVDPDDVVEIEEVEEPWQKLPRLQATLGQGTADERFQLARWCAEHELIAAAAEAYRSVLDVDPDHAGARRALGFVRHEGEWMTPAERNRALGLVFFEGEWMSEQAFEARVEEQKRQQELALARAEADAERAREEAAAARREAAEALARRAEAEAARDRYDDRYYGGGYYGGGSLGVGTGAFRFGVSGPVVIPGRARGYQGHVGRRHHRSRTRHHRSRTRHHRSRTRHHRPRTRHHGFGLGGHHRAPGRTRGRGPGHFDRGGSTPTLRPGGVSAPHRTPTLGSPTIRRMGQ